MGEVTTPGLDTTTQAAIKTLIQNSNKDSPAKIRKRLNSLEMKIWTSLPLDRHIARFIGYLVEEYYGNIHASLVSQWYPNGHLGDYMESKPDADREQRSNDVVCGLIYLHENDPPIIHGDLKPKNVLVDDSGRAILCDFEMSVAFDVTPTGFTTSIIGGATRYLAPELMDVEPRTFAGDIYACGCVILESMCGQSPYAGKLGSGIFSAVQRKEPPYTFSANHSSSWRWHIMPSQFRDLLQSCWDVVPEKRPLSRDIVNALSPITSLRVDLTPFMERRGLARASEPRISDMLHGSRTPFLNHTPIQLGVTTDACLSRISFYTRSEINPTTAGHQIPRLAPAT